MLLSNYCALGAILIFIVIVSFTLFYIYNFNLFKPAASYIFINRYLDANFFWWIFGLITLFYLDIFTFKDVLFLDRDSNISNTINVGANIEVDKDAAEALVRNVGLSTTTGLMAGAVCKTISKSSLPPLQRAGLVLASGAIGAGIHIISSNLNRVISNNTTNKSSFTSTSILKDNSPSSKTNIVSKLIDDSRSEGNLVGQDQLANNSELMNVLIGLEMITYGCLYLIIILFMIILLKFYLK
ncbi:hypothetical protein HRG_mt000015 (mitochondrion) [Hirsutella rhossiliensis]|uniref:Uncharacterized protein n=1 Tax=Hirsutella rhossiliensis TaxID=111463 RepID=A0A161F716_9HYPO|nr:hypothetical protein A8G56_gp19 [Hirsutella rhossiliensis]AMO02221.1 hypothetical protein [Hirsutella rhossiliensis]AYU58489.1 hypothetical protein [Hirsutella rhossiliensis]KAH0956885.1 hypothetical protein HRG_mt00015 [Hirsutella rhossiliensis]